MALAKGVAGWISGPRNTFLLIQKFHKYTKDHLPPLPQCLGSFPQPTEGNQGEGAQCQPFQTLAQDVPTEQDLLGKVEEES